MTNQKLPTCLFFTDSQLASAAILLWHRHHGLSQKNKDLTIYVQSLTFAYEKRPKFERNQSHLFSKGSASDKHRVRNSFFNIFFTLESSEFTPVLKISTALLEIVRHQF